MRRISQFDLVGLIIAVAFLVAAVAALVLVLSLG